MDRSGHTSCPRDLTGIALSGGGIRSATFSLGVLQELNRLGLLGMFDYLSTVSGGGFTGGWWSAWLSRPYRHRPGLFPDAEEIETARRSRADEERQRGTTAPDGALCAGTDPIHHLRLFSNYLTPRKGALSTDTWRAVTIVARNLILTWLVLIPVLLVAVASAQLFFVAHPETVRGFVATSPRPTLVPDAGGAPSPAPVAVRSAPDRLRADRVQAIRERAAVAARPLVFLLGIAVVCTLWWMLVSPAQMLGDRVGPALGKAVVALVIALAGLLVAAVVVRTLVQALAGGEIASAGEVPAWGRWGIWGGVAGVVAIAAVLAPELYHHRRRRRHGDAVAPPLLPADLVRNRIVRVHSRAVMGLVLVAVLLGVGGFAHDLAWYLFDPTSGGPLPEAVQKAGGWLAVLLTLGASLFTALRSAPSGKGEVQIQEPGRASRFVFALAPVLLVTLLAFLSATISRTVIVGLGASAGGAGALTPAVLAGAGFCLLLAAYEMWSDDAVPGARRGAVLAAALLSGIVGYWFAGAGAPWAMALTAAGGILVAARVAAALWEEPPRRSPPRAEAPKRTGWLARLRDRLPGWPRRLQGRKERTPAARPAPWSALLFGGPRYLWMLPAGVAGWGGWRLGQLPESAGQLWLSGLGGRTAVAGLAALGGFALFEVLAAPQRRTRTLILLALAFAGVGAMVGFRLADPTAPVSYSSAAAAIVAVSVTWVVGLGWMADPNQLSLHAFYKARLVRAYLGASNHNREREEITDAAPGDDLPLAELRNCEEGAPYHLVNATLNLVGGRDLTTAQRSSDYFTLSSGFCGSLRTGFRPTAEYMDGKMSLGTAVAVSGAAASPNMGSRTPSAALAMLMAFFNVRLGFWAPTPSRPLWRSPQARLWPYHLLRECVSQTNDLSSYCCLTDGGHFDNTGLYALVARGCRFIVVVDCGADPGPPCFEDVGTAIRRCRIDFQAEIILSIDTFRPEDGKLAGGHFVVGEVVYSPEHIRELTGTPEQVRGRIVWIKPALTGRNSADLQQYGLQNSVFPQQTTGDQWFDEAQFESYRRLGVESARAAFGGAAPKEGTRPAPSRVFDRLGAKPGAPRIRVGKLAGADRGASG